ncbi:hypothetical protein JCM11641_007490 [Rhodosporidiobolus odoratus]
MSSLAPTPSGSSTPADEHPQGERSSLLPRNPHHSNNFDSLDSDVDPFASPGAHVAKVRSYGSTTPGSREEQAFATLPARLSRAKSLDRKRARQQAQRTKWQSLSTRAKYYVPILDWVPKYTLRQFGGDVTAALTASRAFLTSMIIPQSMSYSTNLVHSDPVYGLFAAAIPSMLYSVLGTCRQLSVGPEAALSLITGETIARFLEEEEHAHGPMNAKDKMMLITTVTTIITFQSGLITFLLGFFRLGFLDAILSRALLRGFITAVGLVIFVTQALPILGIEHGLNKVYGASSTLPEKVYYILTHFGDAHRLTVLVSGVALAVLVGAKLFKRQLSRRKGFRFLNFVPEVLVVVLVSTLLSHLLNWQSHGLAVLGHVSPGAVNFRLPLVGWGHLGGYAHRTMGTATVIAVLGFLDSIVAAKDQASKFDYPISPNRELCALGFANLFNSLCAGSLQGYGSITRSRLAAATGATTQMASLLTGSFILLVTYTMLGLLTSLPKCILAVVVCVVVFSILEEAPEDLMFFWKMRAWVDGGLMLLTFFLSLFINVEVGIIVSVSLSLILALKRSTSVRISILARIPETSLFEPLDSDSDDDAYEDPLLASLTQGQEEVPGVLIARIRDTALTFANTGALKERLRRLERYGPKKAHPADEPSRGEASVVVFQLADVVEVDVSALQILREVVESYAGRSVLVYWTNCQPRVLSRLREAGVVSKSGGDSHVQPTVQLALQELQETMVEVVGPEAAEV